MASVIRPTLASGRASVSEAQRRGEAHDVVAARQGRAVQVEPMKPVLKAPGSTHSKLRYDGPLSNFALNFNLRRYIKLKLIFGTLILCILGYILIPIIVQATKKD
jgi:hypothetical protein